MNFRNTFVTIAPDSNATQSIIPTARGDARPVHLIQYELLKEHPYRFTFEELTFETHVRRLGLTEEEVKARRDEIWQQLFSKPQPCLRTSALAKKYGWGFHYNQDGRIAMYAVESDEYRRLSQGGENGLKILAAMRSKR